MARGGRTVDVDIDGGRRLLNVSPEEMSDEDLRVAWILYACD
jgi:hypothetical protein